jgi:hypothetical protein
MNQLLEKKFHEKIQFLDNCIKVKTEFICSARDVLIEHPEKFEFKNSKFKFIEGISTKKVFKCKDVMVYKVFGGGMIIWSKFEEKLKLRCKNKSLSKIIVNDNLLLPTEGEECRLMLKNFEMFIEDKTWVEISSLGNVLNFGDVSVNLTFNVSNINLSEFKGKELLNNMGDIKKISQDIEDLIRGVKLRKNSERQEKYKIFGFCL